MLVKGYACSLAFLDDSFTTNAVYELRTYIRTIRM